MLSDLTNMVIPWYVKYLVGAGLALSLFGYGYVKGLEKGAEKAALVDTKVIVKQGKITTNTVIKYVTKREKQKVDEEKAVNEGKGYAIKFTDNYRFNNEFVRLFDQSVKGSIPPLPSGEAGKPSAITVPEVLGVSINNVIVAKQWRERAELCEAWALEQEEANP